MYFRGAYETKPGIPSGRFEPAFQLFRGAEVLEGTVDGLPEQARDRDVLALGPVMGLADAHDGGELPPLVEPVEPAAGESAAGVREAPQPPAA